MRRTSESGTVDGVEEQKRMARAGREDGRMTMKADLSLVLVRSPHSYNCSNFRLMSSRRVCLGVLPVLVLIPITSSHCSRYLASTTHVGALAVRCPSILSALSSLESRIVKRLPDASRALCWHWESLLRRLLRLGLSQIGRRQRSRYLHTRLLSSRRVPI